MLITTSIAVVGPVSLLAWDKQLHLQPIQQVSISSTFHEQLFRLKVLFTAFLYLHVCILKLTKAVKCWSNWLQQGHWPAQHDRSQALSSLRPAWAGVKFYSRNSSKLVTLSIMKHFWMYCQTILQMVFEQGLHVPIGSFKKLWGSVSSHCLSSNNLIC